MPPEPKGTNDDTQTVSFGEILTDASGRQWKVQGMGGQGFRLFDPVTKEVRSISGAFQTSLGSYIQIDNRGNVLAETNTAPPGFPTGGTGGTGGTAPSYASSQASQTQQETFLAGQNVLNTQSDVDAAKLLADAKAASDKADQDFLTEQNALAEEAALKRQRLSTLTDLIQSFIGAQSQARDTLANLQPDPFRFAAVAGGIAPFGTTPQQGFQTQLQQFANAPVPQFDASGSAASLEPVIAQLTGAQAPQAPQTFGMAQGGTVTPSAQPQSFLVGEKGPEVMTVTAQGVQVTPLAGGMAEGGAIGFPFQPIKFDKETLLPALGTSGIFGSIGLQGIPQRTMFNPVGETVTGNFGALSKLGIEPRFVREIGSGFIWRIQNGVRQYVTDPRALEGLNPADIVVGQASEIARLAPTVGTSISTLAQTNPPVPTTQPSAFTKFSAPIIEPTTGTLLPAPFMVAEQMNKLRLTNPTAFNLLLSAYEAAGVPATAALSSIQSSLAFGSGRGSVGLR